MSSRNLNSLTSRRGLLAAALGSALPLAAASRITRQRISAITDEIARTPADAIAFLKQYGLSWAELRSVPGARQEYFLWPEPDLKQAAREFRDAGIRVSFLNTSMLKYVLPGTKPANPRARDTGRFEKHREELDRAIAAAHILGVDKVRVFTFTRVEEPASLNPRLAEILNAMAETAGRAKIRLLIENEGSCNVATNAELTALLKLVPSKWVGINWDPLNAAHRKEVAFPDGYNLLPHKRIANVQIKGRSILPGPELMDWGAIFRRLERDGYRGQIGLETHIFGDIQIQKSHESMEAILKLVTT